ncbi:MAG: SDR family oxidoreductase [Rhodobacteraceae bacterium]|nr:SDR family oxidoreductase [Paracoccaceae bacterium]
MTDLSGKTAIITGASRGIGAAAARHLAGLGATVVLAARSEADIAEIAAEIVAAGGRALAVPCDVASATEVRALIDRAHAETGRIDILVNNAGVIEPVARLADSDPEAWGAVVDINLKGVYYGLRFAIPEMLKAGGGTVINISSGAATGALEGWSHYCATKAGVLSLTKVADLEYRDRGIRVIGLSPGTVATEMQVQIRASGINPVSQLDPSVHIPADWVARAIAWLCGPAADDWRGTDFSLKTPEGRAAVGLPT